TSQTGATFSVTGGNLPPGLSLSSDGTISGSPTTAGNFTGSVTAVSAIGTISQAFNITVNPPVTISPGSLPPGDVNLFYRQTITAAAGTGAKTLSVTNVQNVIPGLSIPA